MTVDQDRLDDFLGRFVGDLGATMAAGSIVIGHRLGLYQALAERPATPDELADRTGATPRYVAEWLRGQAAGGYVEFDTATGRFSLTPEQAFTLADPDGPVYVPGAFVLALGALRAESQITDAFRTGAGMGWHEHHDDVPAARCSSGRATSRTSCRAGSPRSTGWRRR
jgi:transcriptional regulator with XRE-family HTH domain